MYIFSCRNTRASWGDAPLCSGAHCHYKSRSPLPEGAALSGAHCHYKSRIFSCRIAKPPHRGRRSLYIFKCRNTLVPWGGTQLSGSIATAKSCIFSSQNTIAFWGNAQLSGVSIWGGGLSISILFVIIKML